jgi:hypothetical protein
MIRDPIPVDAFKREAPKMDEIVDEFVRHIQKRDLV